MKKLIIKQNNGKSNRVLQPMSVSNTQPNYIQLALNSSPYEELDLKSFIVQTKFPINVQLADSFYAQMKNDIPIYLGKYEIEFFGYKGPLKKQKEKIMRALKNNFLNEKGISWWEYSNKEYGQFIKTNAHSIYPKPTTFNSNRTKHVLITPYVFEHLLLLSNTTKSYKTRDMYINLRKLIYLYLQYGCEFNKRTLSSVMKQITTCTETKQYNKMLKIKELEQNIQQRHKIGCVYFIQEDETKRIKIGWCWNLKTRLETLQVANSQNLIVVKTVICQYPHIVEQHLHETNKEYHIRGEWFDASIINL